MRIVSLLLLTALAACSGAATSPSVPVNSTGAAPAAAHSLGRHSTLYSFFGGDTGGGPQAALLLHNGLLYGTTASYGEGYGTIFSIDAFGKLRRVYAFSGYPDGEYPEAALIWYNGALYGTTSAGGVHGAGTIFSVTAGGVERVLHSFGRRGDGSLPAAGLVEVNGVLYGTTEYGGLHNKGTVFTYGLSGESVLHSFAGAPDDGGHPTAGLIRYKSALYGTTRAGGQIASGGTVYRITPFGQASVLHSFGVKAGDGENPAGPLVVVNGEFYGTTLHGGNRSSDGTVFAVSPSGSEQVLHAFAGGSDGAYPLSGLVAVNGELYGTTMNGGLYRSDYCIGNESCGTIFKVDAFGREQVIYRFRGDPDGANPEAGLAYVGGVLYGTTTWGGRYDYYGTVFRTQP
jgi:uncharacterized repeat protein (TIGR03803 family)